MAKDYRLTNARAQAAMDALFGTSADAGVLRVYEGVPPAGEPSAGATHGTLLAELTMNATAFAASAASGSYTRLTANAVASDASANASGTPGYFVLYDSAGTTALCQGTVGVAGADCIVSPATIVATEPVSCTGFTFDLPKGWTA